jgi:hypothetical protein
MLTVIPGGVSQRRLDSLDRVVGLAFLDTNT